MSDKPRFNLSRWVLLAYGAPGVPLAALTLPVYILLPTFYATTLGLGLASVGLALVIARVWDAFSDPIIGYLSDQTRHEGLGRRMPWILGGLVPVMLGTWQLLMPPSDAGLVHLMVWSVVLYTGWTAMILPLSAMGAEISDSYHERSRIAGFRE
ncbi:MAG: MFS transporter, partial [Pseudomonadota bacterium]